MNFALLGSFVNMAAVFVASMLGLVFKKGISKKVSDTVMMGMALCVMWIGFKGAVKGENAIVIIISILFGSIIGELIDFDKWINKLGSRLEAKIGTKHGDITQGFVTSTLLFCVGAMAVLGPLESGLRGIHTTQYTKSVLDFVSALIYSSALGVGVAFSAISVFIFQGTITIFAQWIAPLLTDAVITEMTAVGSLLIVGLSLNMLNITKFKIMNYLPSVFLPILFCRIYDWLVNVI